ncbi:MAG: NTP transferase domain-containing protein [Candidatus Glassbacteria bacterium]|nr:NTP transferase domain-containing protein [Candidatus Glassbacteria bacterium]
MKALVIAAGMGSGFNGHGLSSHKTLNPVWGVSVIERILAAFPPLEELVVVTGYEHEKLEAELARKLSARVELKFIHNPDWRGGNGLSVLAAREALSGERVFLLSMSDHVFDSELVNRLTAATPPAGGCALAVDRDLAGVYDLDDATKVKLADDGRITMIGKTIDSFDAADTGVFYCTSALFEALAEAAEKGGESLSDGIRLLCGKERMAWRDVTGCLWQDVDNLDCLRETRRRLWQRAAKARDGVVSRLLNRRISGLVTRLIAPLPVRPNHVTGFNLLLAATAGALLATGHLIAGGLTVQLYSVLDGVDGELARLKVQGSWLGAWLDNLTDRLCDWLIVAGAALSVVHTGYPESAAWILLCFALVSNIAYRSGMDTLLISGALRNGELSVGILSRIENWFRDREMVFGMTHDVYLLVLALGVAAGRPLATLALLIALESLWWLAKSAQARSARPSETYTEYLQARKLERYNESRKQIAELAAR